MKISEILIVFCIIIIVTGMIYTEIYMLNHPSIVVLNGCQYLKAYNYNSFQYIHLGNCTNAIHKH